MWSLHHHFVVLSMIVHLLDSIIGGEAESCFGRKSWIDVSSAHSFSAGDRYTTYDWEWHDNGKLFIESYVTSALSNVAQEFHCYCAVVLRHCGISIILLEIRNLPPPKKTSPHRQDHSPRSTVPTQVEFFTAGQFHQLRNRDDYPVIQSTFWRLHIFSLTTLNYFGVNNVRDGSCCKIKISQNQIEKATQTNNRGCFWRECCLIKGTCCYIDSWFFWLLEHDNWKCLQNWENKYDELRTNDNNFMSNTSNSWKIHRRWFFSHMTECGRHDIRTEK